MKRYLVRALVEMTPEVAAALAAASIGVQGGGSTPTDPFGEPGVQHHIDVDVNATSAEDALGQVRDALKRWGDVRADVVAEEPL